MNADTDVRNLLASGNADHNRPLLTWAIALNSIGTHCASTLALLERRYVTEWFGYGGGIVRIRGGRRGAELTRYDGTEHGFVARITWAEVYDLVTPELVGADLIAEMRDAMAVRRERTRTPNPTRKRDWYLSDEAIAERDAWADIERRCDDLGAQAWLRCRPADVREPEDLLELLAAMSGAA